ncbi:MAG TPA: alpha/beta hydrolase, partial [Actinomycetota bacterium]|nr:alpha/beta hydrolase [Actinomycetota bacterium]
MIDLDPEPHLVRSFDDTLIAARFIPGGEGLPLLVANAVGARLSIWRLLLPDILEDRPVIMWDQRGLFDSEPGASERVDPGAQVEDAIATLDHFDVDSFAVAGWSTGGRIALEIAHDYPERVEGLVLVCAGYGHSMTRLLRLELVSLLPRLAGVAKVFAAPLGGALRGLVSRPEIAGLVRQTGITAASADTSLLVDMLREIASCDTRRLLENYEAIAGSPAPSLVRGIRARTLIIAGEHDQFT